MKPGDSGSCCDGVQREWEQGPPSDAAPGLDVVDQNYLVTLTAERAVSRCDAGANAKRWANAILHPRIDPFQSLLQLLNRHCALRAGLGVRSYRRPNRFNTDARLAMPAHFGEVFKVTVILDTSGSMGADELGLALGLVLKAIGHHDIAEGLKVVTGDTAGRTKVIVERDVAKIDLRGGGGTDMGELIEEAIKERDDASLIVVCTDGHTPWCPRPKVPVGICLTDKRTAQWPTPEWATVIDMQPLR